MILTCFLGVGDYKPCIQYHTATPETQCTTAYIQTALSVFALQRDIQISEIRILATDIAWEIHGQPLTDDLANHGLHPPTRYSIPNGSNEAEFRGIFEQLRQALQGEHVLLDITHGFRAQPFFAAAVVQYMAALDELPETLELHYGQLSDDRSECRIWDLSPFLSLQEWSMALDGFLQYGQGKRLSKLSDKSARHERKTLAQQRNQHLFNESGILIKELSFLSDAIATVRIPHIISAAPYDHHQKNKPTAHAEKVSQAIENCRDSIGTYMPALAPLLDRLQGLLTPLQTTTLEGSQSLQAQQALARQYLAWERPTEAAIVLREAHVSRFSTGEPLDNNTRKAAEDQWHSKDTDNCMSIGQLRNDIQHGGWRPNARRGDSLTADLQGKLEEFESTPARRTAQPAGRTLLVTRHAGAIDWLRQQGFDTTERRDHLDKATMDSLTAEDTIIGSLPVHLAAAVCDTGAKFIYLQIDIPYSRRGEELSDEDMEQYGARLTPFRVISTDE
jgi:CRISPR-associated protein Csx16